MLRISHCLRCAHTSYTTAIDVKSTNKKLLYPLIIIRELTSPPTLAIRGNDASISSLYTNHPPTLPPSFSGHIKHSSRAVWWSGLVQCKYYVLTCYASLHWAASQTKLRTRKRKVVPSGAQTVPWHLNVYQAASTVIWPWPWLGLQASGIRGRRNETNPPACECRGCF